jgi:hypothetical protein
MIARVAFPGSPLYFLLLIEMDKQAAVKPVIKLKARRKTGFYRI